MTATEKKFSPEEVERLLEQSSAAAPPLHLLDDIKNEIPHDPALAVGSRTWGFNRSRTWILAATLATVVVGGFLARRLSDEVPFEPSSSEVDEPSTLGYLDLGTAPDSKDNKPPVQDATPKATEAKKAKELGTLEEGRTRTGARSVGLEKTLPPTSLPVAETDIAERKMDRSHLRELSPATAQPAAPADQEGLTATVEELEAAEFADEIVIVGETRPTVDTVSTESGVIVESSRRKRVRDFFSRKRQEIPKPGRVEAQSGYVGSTGGTAEPNDQPYGDMFFDHYGTNPFIDTEDDALSTFGMDVDTGSYTVARSYLDRGHLPPTDAIRLEEFLNYFDYPDSEPEEGDFALSAEAAPSLFGNSERHYLLRFGIQGRDVATENRPPATLIFVVDVSGSMNQENRLGLVKRSLRLLLGELNSKDRVGLVIYGSQGEVLLQPTSDHERIERAIDRLQAGGSTNAEEGLVLAYDLAREFYREGDINRVILCSDGVANVGRTGPDSILKRIGREADQGIELTTVGFGMGNYNDVLMEQLADKGDGRYAYVDSFSEARRLFVEELNGTLQTIASEAKIQVEFDPKVVSRYRLIGYENRDIADEDFRNNKVDAGEIGAGHHVTALYEIKLRKRPTADRPLATLRVRYASNATENVVEQDLAVAQENIADNWQVAPRGLQQAALVAEFGEILKKSYWARGSDLEEVLRYAQELAPQFAADRKFAEFTGLVAKAAQISDRE